VEEINPVKCSGSGASMQKSAKRLSPEAVMRYGLAIFVNGMPDLQHTVAVCTSDEQVEVRQSGCMFSQHMPGGHESANHNSA